MTATNPANTDPASADTDPPKDESASVSSVVQFPVDSKSIDAMMNENTHLRYLLAFMPIGFCVFDEHDCLQLCNQQYIEVWNLPDRLCLRGTPYSKISEACNGEELLYSGDSALGEAGQKRREFLTPFGRIVEVLVHVMENGQVISVNYFRKILGMDVYVKYPDGCLRELYGWVST